MNRLLFILFLSFLVLNGSAQTFRFAHITDTHIGGNTAAEDLIKTIEDINSLPEIEFVMVTGDLTEFGSGEELREAKSILNRLKVPCFVIPGNHDSKWSESGNNDFVRVFGSESFHFEKNGFLVVGTASGPNMRMAPGLVPREQIVFLDSILKNMKDPEQPVIFVNHYPLDESLSNWYEVIDLLKTRNVQCTFLGHGHANKLFNFEGIPGIMGRSNLRAKTGFCGYNLVTVSRDSIVVAERISGQETLPAWCRLPVKYKRELAVDFTVKRPDFSVNRQFPEIRVQWQTQENSDIGTGISCSGKYAVYATTKGEIVALDKNSGQSIWRFPTSGKIYSTPAIANGKLVCASTDGSVYCLNLKTGKLDWKFETEKPIVASPAIDGNMVFLGSSEGIFRAIDLKSGKLIWQFTEVENFVESKPLVYNGAVYFGSWGNSFYALDKNAGTLLWKREKYTNRMLSPAAVWQVASGGKLFIVAPDRRMTALDAKTGTEIWDSGKYSCRESIGISEDGKRIYIKNMTEGNVQAFDAGAGEQLLVWQCQGEMGYEIGPSPIVQKDGLVFVPTSNGVILACDAKTQQVAWKFKISNALINAVQPIGNQQVLVTSLDGKVACLKY